MRAVGILNFGDPDVLQVVDLPEVHPAQGEVRIRVHAAAVNPTDLMLRNGSRAEALSTVTPPYIPGMDVAGVIDEIGPGSETDLSVGTLVMAMVVPVGSHGAYRESIVLSIDAVTKAPNGFSHPEVSTLPMNGLTARQSLDQLGLTTGQTIAVTGAAGIYGGYVMQIAKHEGLRVIADASPTDEALVNSLGADIIVPRGDDFSEQVRRVMPEGVDGLADGAVLTELAVGAVRDGGTFASVRGWRGTGERDITFHRTSVRDYDHRSDLLDQLRDFAESGVITLRVAGTYNPEETSEAHRRLEARGTRGRCVIVF
ncbi:MAG: NADP-dependent oxidoreductase [SAR202 cluster bacterium]|nr:NADP-dependent oxidoreductase [SAR202 cluster bacterium]|tara:strand:+ start:13184 stop:14122 length:939 start_codon:yes stop_codon:yes gene_type:complete